MKNAAKIEYLSKVPLFSGFSKKDLGEVARHVDTIDVPSGTVLTEEGKLAHQFGVIVEGGAVVRRNKRKLADLGYDSVLSFQKHHPHLVNDGILGRALLATKGEALRAELALKRLPRAQKLRWCAAGLGAFIASLSPASRRGSAVSRG